MRGRAHSETDVSSLNKTRRGGFQKSFPVKSGSDREIPANLPPTPPSESESYSMRRSRSQSQHRSKARLSGGSSSGGASEYTPITRSRLGLVRDDGDSGGTEMRRAKS